MAGKPCTVGITAAAAVTAPAVFNRSRRERSLFSAMRRDTSEKSISTELYHGDPQALMRILLHGQREADKRHKPILCPHSFQDGTEVFERIQFSLDFAPN